MSLKKRLERDCRSVVASNFGTVNFGEKVISREPDEGKAPVPRSTMGSEETRGENRERRKAPFIER